MSEISQIRIEISGWFLGKLCQEASKRIRQSSFTSSVTLKKSLKKQFISDKQIVGGKAKQARIRYSLLKYASIFVGILKASYFACYYYPKNEDISQISKYDKMHAPKERSTFIKTESRKVMLLNPEEEKGLKATEGTLVKKTSGEKITYFKKDQSKNKPIILEFPNGQAYRMI